MRSTISIGNALGSSAMAAIGAAALATAALAQAPKIGDPPEAKNMRLVGANDLQARSAYQPIIHKQGDRYIAYVGHHGGTPAVPKPVNPLTGQAEFNGTSIVDVTDPKQPKYLKHIPGLEGLVEQGGGQMVRACDGKIAARRATPTRSICCAPSADSARNLERHRSGQSHARLPPAERQGHAQELVGMRHRHRLPGLRRRRPGGPGG